MPLKPIGTIEIPDSKDSSFDHAAFDPKTRRVFVAHTGKNCVEVIDHDTGKHIATLPGFPEVAGVVANDGVVLVTNRGAASLAAVDARTFGTRTIFKTGPKPNGVAIVAQRHLGIAACIGDDAHPPSLHVVSLESDQHYSLSLPGHPRWCVTDATGQRLFLAIREPSMVLVATLPELGDVQHWSLPCAGAHGLEIDQERDRLYVACDDANLVEVEIATGAVTNRWPLAGAPDVTFFNPRTGHIHVAIGKPGVVQTIDPRSGTSDQTPTGLRAHTTALVEPDSLYVFSPSHGGALIFEDR